jgi:hypothetical protein
LFDIISIADIWFSSIVHMNNRLVLIIIVALITFHVNAQDSSVIQKLTVNYLDKVSSKINHLEKKLDKKADKALHQLRKQEEKIKKKLSKIDSLKAKEIFGNAEQKYKELEQRLTTKLSGKKYIPSLDTVSTSLKFIEQNPQLVSQIKGGRQKLNSALGKVNGLENKFQQAEEIKEFLKERKQFLKDQLGKFGFAKQFKKLNKQVHYYSEQLNEYKAMLKDHKRAERKAIELLSKTKLFKDFMSKHSMLASLFHLPGEPNDPLMQANLAGLQTRAQVNNLIQQQVAAGGPNAQSQLSQNLQDAQSQLNEVKNKVNKFGGSSSDMEIPEGFKINPEKTKTFFQRLQLNADFQTTRHNNLFPVNSDLGLSIGYKLNEKSMLAIGSSFKLGWGTGFNHIRLSNQGVSIRGGIDWKLKGNLFIAGNYEQNYFSRINNIYQLRNYSNWKTSALLGLNKKYKTRKGRGGEIKILYDFFYNRPPIRTQPLIVRFGYNLK